MQDLKDAISEFWAQLGSVIGTAGWNDLSDILVVAFLLYHTLKLVRETRAMQLVKGIIFVLVFNFVANFFN